MNHDVRNMCREKNSTHKNSFANLFLLVYSSSEILPVVAIEKHRSIEPLVFFFVFCCFFFYGFIHNFYVFH